MTMKRLQGRDAGPPDAVWLGLSRIASGGRTTHHAPRTTLDASPSEKFYVGIEGETTVSNGHDSVTLQPTDSCRVAPGERRQLSNTTGHESVVLLIMAVQPGESPA